MTPSTSALPTDGLSTSAKNDEAIMQALAKLENPIERKKLKLTVDAICELTGLSTNTVRSREWALVKLNEMKQHAKSKRNPIESSSENGVFLDEGLYDGRIARSNTEAPKSECLALRRDHVPSGTNQEA